MNGSCVFFHSPPYTSGTIHGPHTSMQWPIFKDCGKPGSGCRVDAVVSGDNHVYERIERDGIVYFTNGLAGGWPPYDCKAEFGGANDPASKICLGMKSFGQTNSGAQRVTVKRTGGTSELRFEMIDIAGKTWDTKTLQKSMP